jgi:BirA family biotin operon repressor/biotin-[acetyl-CoA-carboxylase] ligase
LDIISRRLNLLQNNTFSGLFVGQKIVKLSAVASTNSYLKDLLSKSEPLPEGTVIMAEEQFAGRGQMGNGWHSEPGVNLCFSVLFNPSFLNIKQQFELNKAVSLAVYDVLSPLLGDDLKIKWPNDILYGKQKLCGILIENMLQGNRWKHAVVGIGLNVNQQHFPAALPQAVSIRNILHRDCDLNTLLADLCKALEVRYLQLKSAKFASLHQDYLKALYQFEATSVFRLQGESREGKITGISPQGFLQIDFGAEQLEFGFKEIAFVID